MKALLTISEKGITLDLAADIGGYYISQGTLLYEGTGRPFWISQVPCRVLSATEREYIVKFYDLGKTTLDKDFFHRSFDSCTPDQTTLDDFDIERYDLAAVRKILKPIQSQIGDTFDLLLKKAHMDAYYSCGDAKNMTIVEYQSMRTGQLEASSLAKYSPYFNRRARNTCVVPAGFDEVAFKDCPIPRGIHPGEFALKSEQNKIFRTLVGQIFGFVGMPPCPADLVQYLQIENVPAPGQHVCKYCGLPMEMSKVAQTYCAKERYLNLCHDDPHGGTSAANVYWGHKSCNREQGGLSLAQRCMAGLKLMTRLLNCPGNGGLLCNKELMEEFRRLEATIASVQT